MRRGRARLQRGAVACVVALVAVACGIEDPTGVRIGVVAPVTGPRSYLGVEVVRGVELAVEDLNDAGGLLGEDVEIVVVDDADLAALPGQLADLAERERVTAVIGPEAPGVLLGTRSPLRRRSVPALLPTAFAGDLDDASTTIVRTVPSALVQATAFARWFHDVRGGRRVALLVADPVEGGAVRDPLVLGLEAGGLDVVAVQAADGDAASLAPAVAALRRDAAGAQAVLLWGPPPAAARATLAVREQGWDVQIAVGASAFVAEYRSLAGDAAEGVVIPFPFRDEWFGSELFNWMLRYYLTHGFGALPQLDTLVVDLPVVAVAAYDAVGLVAQAVEASGSAAPADVATALDAATHDGILRDYVVEDGEVWGVDDLFLGRFHQFGVVFDADGRLDAAAQERFWQQQVNAEFVPDSVLEGPGGAVIAELLDTGRTRNRAFVPPRRGPGPVSRPDDVRGSADDG